MRLEWRWGKIVQDLVGHSMNILVALKEMEERKGMKKRRQTTK